MLRTSMLVTVTHDPYCVIAATTLWRNSRYCHHDSYLFFWKALLFRGTICIYFRDKC